MSNKEVQPILDGWFYVRVHQFAKPCDSDDYADYFNEWFEAVNGKWEYKEYQGRVVVCHILHGEGDGKTCKPE